jgi:hypothetical protein
MAAETPVSHALRVDPDDGSDWTAILAVSLIGRLRGRFVPDDYYRRYHQSDYVFAVQLPICLS